MAQSAITVTPPNPTPPTNMSFLGQTPPNAPDQTTADDGAAGPLTEFAEARESSDEENFPSVEHEAAGTEEVVEGPDLFEGMPAWTTVSVLGDYTATPNADHASSLSPLNPATITLLAPDDVAAAAGTVALTVTGTNFTPQSVVYVDGVAQDTVYVSSTSLTVAAAPKKATAGTQDVTVVTAGAVTTAASEWTFV